jgi:hypothetical protein
MSDYPPDKNRPHVDHAVLAAHAAERQANRQNSILRLMRALGFGMAEVRRASDESMRRVDQYRRRK